MNTQIINPEQLYTSEEVTEYLRVSLRTTQRLLKSGLLPSFRVHGQYRIKGIDVLNYLHGTRRDSEVYETEKNSPEKLIKMLEVSPISLELGISLIPIVDPNQSPEFMEQVNQVRKDIIMELGFIFPGIQIRDNLNLKPNEYNILINGVKTDKNTLYPEKLYARSLNLLTKDINENIIIDPVKKLPAYWLEIQEKEEAENNGFEILTPTQVLLEHIGFITKKYASEILSREEVFVIIERIRKNNSIVVEEVIADDDQSSNDKLSISQLTRILKGLLREKISIRNIRLILESLADSIGTTKDTNLLIEKVRSGGLARQICMALANDDNLIEVISLPDEVEQKFINSLEENSEGHYLKISPQLSQSFQNKLKELIMEKSRPILCSPLIRKPLRNLIERNFNNVSVLSYHDISRDIRLKNTGSIGIEII